ncbi:hypothetical protein [Rathayibacter sp. VKM Ac-2630]|uniref:hypothetical protein n=1 Tax=Rathayibacter sp. VKM Ac-2630 TaxID=1938617 RepID=UPI00156D5BB3|nr:hypothetical protein [Rathayibacter sp. VKM Ac-2630]
MPTPIISEYGSGFVWACLTCGVGSALCHSFAVAAEAFSAHQAGHDAWAADEAEGYDPAECFERFLSRRSA